MEIRLYCEDVEVISARNPKEAHEFREDIDLRIVDLAYMPNVGESISLFTQYGYVEFEIGSRGVSHAFSDAFVKDEYQGKTWYGVWAKKITIMEHYRKDNEEEG